MSTLSFFAGGAAGYQILAPAYYDQSGQLVMSNGRGISTPVRLVSPAPILVTGQQGTHPSKTRLRKQTLRPIHTRRKWEQKRKRSKNKSKTSRKFSLLLPFSFGVNRPLVCNLGIIYTYHQRHSFSERHLDLFDGDWQTELVRN